jgi:voltage-gated potassium channel
VATWRNIFIGVALLAIITFSGTVSYARIEDQPIFDSLYNVFLTITTVGVTLPPQTMMGHLLIMGMLFMGMGTVLYLAMAIATNIVEGRQTIYYGIKGGFMRMRKEKNHVIVAGFGKLGKAVCDTLRQNKKKCVVIEADPEKAKFLIDHGVSTVQGDALEPSILKKAGVEKAKSIVAALGTDANNIYLIMTASDINPDILLAAEATEQTAVKRLHKIGAQIVVLPQVVGGRQLAQAVLEVDKAQKLSTVVKK